jgi:hypothetical protein
MSNDWLPEGWTATAFIDCVELEGPIGQKRYIAKPYDRQTTEWWREQAEDAIKPKGESEK